MYAPDPADVWDNALLTQLLQIGIQNPLIHDKQLYGNQEYLYIVEVDTWPASSRFDAGNTRHYIVWADGKGTANISEAGLTS